MRSGNTLYVGSSGLEVADVNDILHDGGDVGSLCSSSNINKFAKWKPFRMNAISFWTSSEQLQAMKNVHMGFSIPTASVSNNSIVSGEWVYQKPRGLDTYNEWYRLLDFAPIDSTSQAPGYYHDAVCPFDTYWPDEMNNKTSFRVTLFADSQVNSGASNWSNTTSVSLFDCLISGNVSDSYGSYIFALLMVDNAGANRALVSSGVSVSALSSAATKLIEMDICAYEAPVASQSGCKILPSGMLADTKIGNTFDLAWVLVESTTFSGGDVVTTLPATMISLNLENSINLTNLELTRIKEIDGLTGHIEFASPVFTDMNVTDNFSIQEGGTYRLYHLGTVQAYLDVTDSPWKVFDSSTGTISNRTSVTIELGSCATETSGQVPLINVGDAHCFIVTTDVVPNPVNVSLTTAYSSSSYYNGDVAAMKAYCPPTNKSAFTATISKSDGTKTCTPGALPGQSTASVPDIYVWIRTDTTAGTTVLETNGGAWGRYITNSGIDTNSEHVWLDADYEINF